MNRIVAFGALFGFILSRVDATNYDAVHNMFLLTDLHLVGVIGLAIAVAGAGMALVRWRQMPARNGLPMALAKKPMRPGVIVGGLLFGAGWAISGTCPGTALAQLGEGTLAGGVTILGIALGAWLQSAHAARTAHA